MEYSPHSLIYPDQPTSDENLAHLLMIFFEPLAALKINEPRIQESFL